MAHPMDIKLNEQYTRGWSAPTRTALVISILRIVPFVSRLLLGKCIPPYWHAAFQSSAGLNGKEGSIASPLPPTPPHFPNTGRLNPTHALLLAVAVPDKASEN